MEEALHVVGNILSHQFQISESETLDESTMTIYDHRYGKIVYRSHYAICLISIFDRDDDCLGEWEADEVPELKTILWPITWAFTVGKSGLKT
jgi:hypothetical protein